MRRHLGTALSAVGLLVVASGAAAVNVRMLRGDAQDFGSLQMHAAAAIEAATASATATPSATASASPAASVTTTATPRPTSSDGLASVGSVGNGHEGFGDDDGDGDGDGRGHGFGADDRPQLTQAQLTLLRVSAMVRMRPEDVRAIARGEVTDAASLAAIKQAAAAVGATLQQLAAVQNLPAHHERGNGGFGPRHGSGDGQNTLAPVTSNDD